MRKLSLIAAALLMAFAFQPARAADAVEDETAVEAADEFLCPCGYGWRGRGFGPGAAMRQGWRGGPMMHRGWGGQMRGAPMMRQGWRNWDGADNEDPGNDPRRFRRFGPGMGGQFGPGAGAAVQPQQAQPQQPQQAGMGAAMVDSRFMRGLNITDDQRRQMIDIATANFRERLSLRWEMEKARNTLAELSASETPDYDAIIAANEALGSTRGKLDVARRKVMSQFAAVLTPEQREKIEQFRTELESIAEEGAEESADSE